MSKLRILDLSHNSLSGTINTTFSIGNQLEVIKFDGNKLEGKVPQSLINCKYLEVFCLGNNELSDTFLEWLGALSELQILKLRSNKFYGPIKDSRPNNIFARILIIDLSSNGFSWDLPTSLFENFEAMKIIGELKPESCSRWAFQFLNKFLHENPCSPSFPWYELFSNVSPCWMHPKGKQFDTLENNSYQGNDGLRGFSRKNLCKIRILIWCIQRILPTIQECVTQLIVT